MKIQKFPFWENLSAYQKPYFFSKIILAKNLSRFYPQENIAVIAGSVGKTTVARAVKAILEERLSVLISPPNMSPYLGIIQTLLAIRPKTKKIILELEMAKKGDAEYYLSLVKPTTVIVSKISFNYPAVLESEKILIEEISQIIKRLPKKSTIILNWDDPNVRKLADETLSEVIFYGSSPKDCHLWAGQVKLENGGTSFELNYGVDRVKVNLKLLGAHFITSCLAGAAFSLNCGASLMSVKKGLEKLTPEENKMQILEGLNGYLVINDTYKTNLDSAIEALNVLNGLPARRRIVVLGEIKDQDAFLEKAHRQIAQKMYNDKIDFVLLSGEETKYIAEELKELGFLEERVESDLSLSQIVAKLLRVAGKGDIILVKGAKSSRLEEVAKRISQQ